MGETVSANASATATTAPAALQEREGAVYEEEVVSAGGTSRGNFDAVEFSESLSA